MSGCDEPLPSLTHKRAGRGNWLSMKERDWGKLAMRGAGQATLLALAFALASCGGDLVPRGRVERPSKPPKGARPSAPPPRQIADGPFDFLLWALIDYMHHRPGKTRGQQLGGAVEQSRDTEPAYADQRDAGAHRSWNQSAMADETRIGGIDRTPTRRY